MGDFSLFGLPVSLGTMIYQAIIFTILVFILKKLVFKKMVDILEKRKHHIEKQLLLTEQYKQEAEQNLEASKVVLKQAKKEAREIRTYSENEAQLLIHDAKVEAKDIVKKAKEDTLLHHARPFSHSDQIKEGA
ncbi:F0F1-type ATP synthase membrane subunit b/b' [Bacillus sp. SLBN-46]|uniref:ATP synthase F0 subunit B n=1 Tax=Bacillus sp. SLBN-46 TaxID=3042283 RepID=UPI0028640F4D|nr:ATP synthase F0 subunit B [Bacillus sp. SLBN-46]MDR6124698.1 F0F1-type ATP synthase membrane subunit b/b' [Bacillus sp. SLBN-46]